eukprot:jgi/Botrbrau1/22427/Bobra.0091s0029.1
MWTSAPRWTLFGEHFLCRTFCLSLFPQKNQTRREGNKRDVRQPQRDGWSPPSQPIPLQGMEAQRAWKPPLMRQTSAASFLRWFGCGRSASRRSWPSTASPLPRPESRKWRASCRGCCSLYATGKTGPEAADRLSRCVLQLQAVLAAPAEEPEAVKRRSTGNRRMGPCKTRIATARTASVANTIGGKPGGAPDAGGEAVVTPVGNGVAANMDLPPLLESAFGTGGFCKVSSGTARGLVLGSTIRVTRYIHLTEQLAKAVQAAETSPCGGTPRRLLGAPAYVR